VELVQSAAGESLRQKLWERVEQCAAIASAGKGSQGTDAASSAILPVIVGDETNAVALAAALRERGVFIPAIRYPTVARGAARLRITVTAAHTTSDLAALADAWRKVAAQHPELTARTLS
jgi:7-keto-8-aminopelargonate synthetase-like enzyme